MEEHYNSQQKNAGPGISWPTLLPDRDLRSNDSEGTRTSPSWEGFQRYGMYIKALPGLISTLLIVPDDTTWSGLLHTYY